MARTESVLSRSSRDACRANCMQGRHMKMAHSPALVPFAEDPGERHAATTLDEMVARERESEERRKIVEASLDLIRVAAPFDRKGSSDERPLRWRGVRLGYRTEEMTDAGRRVGLTRLTLRIPRRNARGSPRPRSARFRSHYVLKGGRAVPLQWNCRVVGPAQRTNSSSSPAIPRGPWRRSNATIAGRNCRRGIH